MEKDNQNPITGFLTLLAGVIVIFCMVMGVYLFAGFGAWVLSDPLDLFEDGPMFELEPADTYTAGERRWDDCVRSTKQIFDDFNDTVAATYALEDKPSTEAQAFMKLCLEENN